MDGWSFYPKRFKDTNEKLALNSGSGYHPDVWDWAWNLKEDDSLLTEMIYLTSL